MKKVESKFISFQKLKNQPGQARRFAGKKVIVWNTELKLWWSKSGGYTPNKDFAIRYDLEDAFDLLNEIPTSSHYELHVT